MKHKVSELEGALLDAAVAKAEGDRLPDYWLDPANGTPWLRPGREEWHPSERWDQGGPIIERHNISMAKFDEWAAMLPTNSYRGEEYIDARVEDFDGYGPTPLIAAMRAYVASKFGEDVKLP